MENIVVPPTDDEREDGEIVDEFEDISDSSIPSCGKSDYSQDILRAISLSSISDNSDGAEMSLRKRRRKRNRCKSDHPRRKKKRKHDELLRLSRKRRSLSTNSSSSDSDDEKLDKRMLRQLKEAVRINQSNELHHNSLRSRLKAMIDPDSQEDEDVEYLRTLALLTKNENSPKPDLQGDDNEVRDMEVDDDKDPPGEIIEKCDDTLTDKELAELRSEALKSAVIKKHIERKKRKEQDQKENNNDLQNKDLKSNDKENKEENEEDVDVMRAMLLASISKRITSAPKNPTCKPAITSTPNPIIRTALQNKQTNAKPPQLLKLPSVKPLIIRLNSDSESDLDKSSSGNATQETNNPLDETVSKLLRMHREKFEAKEKESEIEKGEENLLDKSVVKLLSKAQQREYQLLKQKLLMANKKKVRRMSNRVRAEEKSVQSSSNLKETLQDLQFHKDGRLQMKGKYKELAPLIQKVNVASERKKQCEEKIKVLLAKLKEARVEHTTSHENYVALVQKLKQAKENIDLRLTKLASANTNTGIKPQPPTSVIPILESNLMLPTVEKQNVTNSADVINKKAAPDSTEITNVILPVESQIKTLQKKKLSAIDEKDVMPAKVQKMINPATVPAQNLKNMQKKMLINTQEKLIVASKVAEQKLLGKVEVQKKTSVDKTKVIKNPVEKQNEKKTTLAVPTKNSNKEIDRIITSAVTVNNLNKEIEMITTSVETVKTTTIVTVKDSNKEIERIITSGETVKDNNKEIGRNMSVAETVKNPNKEIISAELPNTAEVQKISTNQPLHARLKVIDKQTNSNIKTVEQVVEHKTSPNLINPSEVSPKKIIPVLIHRTTIPVIAQPKFDPSNRVVTYDTKNQNNIIVQVDTNITGVQKKNVCDKIEDKINSSEILKKTSPSTENSGIVTKTVQKVVKTTGIQKKINPVDMNKSKIQEKNKCNNIKTNSAKVELTSEVIEDKSIKKIVSVSQKKQDSFEVPKNIQPLQGNNENNPTIKPSENPTIKSFENPTIKSCENPTIKPSENPTIKSSKNPTIKSSENPSIKPWKNPTIETKEIVINNKEVPIGNNGKITSVQQESVPAELKLTTSIVDLTIEDDEKIPTTTDSQNDTDAINKRAVNKASSITFSEYISPLDRRNQIASSNPQQMLCPYELFGTCRDQDCVFNHCP